MGQLHHHQNPVAGASRRRQAVFFISAVVLCAILLLFAGGRSMRAQEDNTAAPPKAYAHTLNKSAAADDPLTIVWAGVDYFTLAAKKIYWQTRPFCGPSLLSESAGEEEAIGRIAVIGSPLRQLFSHIVDDPCYEPGWQIRSNITADDNYLYWFNDQGLQRLSTNANVGDLPQKLAPLPLGKGEVANGDGYVYALAHSGMAHAVWQVDKSNGNVKPLASAAAGAKALSTNGVYLYWLEGTNLRRHTLADGQTETIAAKVSSYYAEPPRVICAGGCANFYFVLIAQGDHIIQFENSGKTTSPLYTASGDYAASAVIYNITSSKDHIFFFEQRDVMCRISLCAQASLLRAPRTGGSAEAPLYITNETTKLEAPGLLTDGKFLYWREGQQLRRLAANAAALQPGPNMAISSLVLTQGIQETNYNNQLLPLIKGRRTFVRARVLSTSGSVPDVTAHLYGSSAGQLLSPGPLLAIEPYITVIDNAIEANMANTFFFELPLAWTEAEDLQLRVELNPFHLPLEPTYSDNTRTINAPPFIASPRLDLVLIAFGYDYQGGTRYPRKVDIDNTLSWLRRAYPLASTPGWLGDKTPGLRSEVRYVDGGAWLARLVNRTDPFCLLFFSADDRDLCATEVINQILFEWRLQGIGLSNLWEGLLKRPLYYGLVQTYANRFVRGQAGLGDGIASGPAGRPGNVKAGFWCPNGSCGWDTDGSYADWYAGHEIAHALDRRHIGQCGQSNDDKAYPYAVGRIGQQNEFGFDAGDPGLGINYQIYPSWQWRDVMSYCPRQWMSDYTYVALRKEIQAWNDFPATQQDRESTGGLQAGDYLIVSGILNAAGSEAWITRVQHTDSMLEIPAQTPGGYSLQLLDANGKLLAAHDFTPQGDADGDLLSFTLVVNFLPGTREVAVATKSSGKMLASSAVSANPPVVASVAQKEVSSATPEIRLVQWNASDTDGDDLTYDLLFSANRGDTFQMLKSALEKTSAQVDTSQLGGGSQLLFRVVASDGAHTAYADTPLFALPWKAPLPVIHLPANGTHIRYGQLLNFLGEAKDYQLGGVPPSTLRWLDKDGAILANGPSFSTSELPAGENIITLRAFSGRTIAETSVTIYVDDEFGLSQAALAVAPETVGWHVNAGETAQQTAEIQISNAGEGQMDWVIEGGAPWLSLSKQNGSAPDTVVLSADPAGLAPDETYSLTLTLKAEDEKDTAHTADLPVSLSIGNVWHPQGTAGGSVYLPLTVRP